jgi:oxysterol-binding protein-related protein 3/6/7
MGTPYLDLKGEASCVLKIEGEEIVRANVKFTSRGWFNTESDFKCEAEVYNA